MMNETRGTGSSGRRGWVAPLVILAIALALRLIHLYQIRANPFFYHPIVDAWDYHSDALRMIRSGDWTGDRAFFQAPLTTYFLALVYKCFGVDLLWPRIVQALLGGTAAAGMFILARKLFGERAAWIAGLLAACYPLFIFFEGELLAPAITMFLDVGFLLLLFGIARDKRSWIWILPGLVLGLRALATTNILAVVPVFWIWLILRGRGRHWTPRKMVSAIIMFTLGAAVVVAPVTVRNRMLQDEFVLVSSNAGLNFYLGNSGDYDGRIAIRPGADFDELIETHVRAGRRVGPEMSGYFFAEARRYAATNPSEYSRLLLHKTCLFLGGGEIMRNQEIYPFRGYSAVLRSLLWTVHLPGGAGLAVPFGLLLPLAWPGCLLALRRRNSNALLLLAYGAGYSLSVIAFFITARYRLPVVLPMILILAYGWSQIRGWWHPVRMRTAALAGMLVLLVLSNWNVKPMPGRMNPDAYYSLAGTLADQGDLEGAESFYSRALEMNPLDAAAWVNLGLRVYQEEGMLGRAESCYRRALGVRPDYAGAVYNLAFLAELQHMPEKAESLYLETMRLNPLMDAPYINVAALALSRGDLRRAHEYYLKAYGVNPENPRTLVGLGVTTFRRRGFDPAMEFFSQAIKLDPEFPDTYVNLALIYSISGKPLEAANHARYALKLDPLDDEAYIFYADYMREAGREVDARRFLEAATRQYPYLPGPRQALKSLRP